MATWKISNNQLSAPGEAAAATLLQDGQILLSGGRPFMGQILADAFFFDPVADLFSMAPHMTVPRIGQTLTTLGSGRVLAAGGEAGGTTGIYDPVTSGWTP